MKAKQNGYISLLLAIAILFAAIFSGLAAEMIADTNIEKVETEIQLLVKYANLENYQFEKERIKRITQTEAQTIEHNEAEQWEILQFSNQEIGEQYLNRLADVDMCLYIDYYQGQVIDWSQCQLSGEGTVMNPFLVYTEDDLKMMEIYNNADYKLMNDIVLTEPWMPIKAYAGTFNGNGYTLSNIIIAEQENGVTGFFNTLYPSAYVLNARFDYANASLITGMIAKNNNGRIIDCFPQETLNINPGTVDNTQTESNIDISLTPDTSEQALAVTEEHTDLSESETNTVSTLTLSGSGTEADPYLVYTKYDLDAVRNDLGACYKQMADIVFEDSDYLSSGAFYNTGNLFVPLGIDVTSSNPNGDPFTGMYDGNGYEIQNLQMLGWNGDYIIYSCALFNSVKKVIDSDLAIVKNIILKDANIQPDAVGGGIVSTLHNATVEGCVFDGYLYSPGGGGICATAYDSIIRECLNFGTIQTFFEAGAGIVSAASNTNIDQCINKGIVSGTTVATICANANHTTTIQNSYNTATLDGVQATMLGGIAIGGNIINCYNKGDIIPPAYPSEYDLIGAIRDTSVNSDQCQNNYYLKISEICGTEEGDVVGKFTSLTESQMRQQSSFVGFDFENIWEIDATSDYPYPTLRWENHTEEPSVSIIENQNHSLYTALKRARPSLDAENDGIITAAELNGITGTLDLSNSSIDNLHGLQGCIQISQLYINDNKISDLLPISALEQLVVLVADNNDLNVVTDLPSSLKVLNLENNQLEDASGVLELNDLEIFFAGDNNLTIIDFLNNKVNLEYLSLNNNQISDITPLQNSLLLKYVDLSYNQISDINALLNKMYLKDLRLSHNNISTFTLSPTLRLHTLFVDNNYLDPADLISCSAINKLYLPQKD